MQQYQQQKHQHQQHHHRHRHQQQLPTVKRQQRLLFCFITTTIGIFVAMTPPLPLSSSSSSPVVAGMSSSSISSSRMNSSSNNNIKSRLVYGKDDVLFGTIEDIQREQTTTASCDKDHTTDGISTSSSSSSFGHILDAGTGVHSIRWIATLVGVHTNNLEDNASSGAGSGAGSGVVLPPPPTCTKFTAITADTTMQRNVQDEVDALGISHMGQVVVGNWFPSTTSTNSTTTTSTSDGTDVPSTLGVGTATTQTHGSTSSLDLWLDPEGYDTILADYLIGAMDGFSPYQQDEIIPLLAKYLKPGGRLYIVGLQPLPDKVPVPPPPSPPPRTTSADGNSSSSLRANAEGANIVCRVRQVRDACILLAGHRCYREYPIQWVERQIRQEPTLTLLHDGNNNNNNNGQQQHTFPILYRYTTIQKQIQVARSKLKFFPSQHLANHMSRTLDELDHQAKLACEKLPGNKIKLGFDYVVTAEKKQKDDVFVMKKEVEALTT